MAVRTELSVRLGNSPGAVADVCQILRDAGVNILALALEAGGTLRLVLDNPLHAAGELAERRHAVQERDVLFIQLPNAPGGAATIARMLAGAGISIDYAYGAAIEGAPMAAIVIGVADAQRASAAVGV